MRHTGYYWVKMGIFWEIAHWNGAAEHWTIHGEDGRFSDGSWSGINEHRIVRANHFAGVSNMVPEGWQLVPTNPTREMFDAWDGAPSNHEDDDVNMVVSYQAMLAAAPKPQGGAA